MARPSDNYSDRERQQDRKFLAVLYPDSADYDCNISLNYIKGHVESFFYILHDRDTYNQEDYDLWDSEEECPFKVGDFKKPHYHIVFTYSSPTLLGLASKHLKVPSNYIQRVKKLESAIQYLVHLNNLNKYQYSIDEVICNDTKTLTKYLSKVDCLVKANSILTFILETNPCYTSLVSWSIENGCYSEVVRAFPVWKSVLSESSLAQKKFYEVV